MICLWKGVRLEGEGEEKVDELVFGEAREQGGERNVHMKDEW